MSENRKPEPLETPRYGVPMTGAMGLFDTAGWPGPGQYAGFDTGDVRRDYGPQGCAGILLGVTAVLLLAVAFAIVFLVVA